MTRRLMVAYGTALFFTLFTFAYLMLALVNYTERAEYGKDLLRIAHAVNGLSTWHGGAFHPHEINEARIAEINSTLAESAIFSSNGSTVYSSSPTIPAFVHDVVSRPPSRDTVGPFRTTQDHWLAAISPMFYNGVQRGVIVTWHSQATWMHFTQSFSSTLIFSAPIFAGLALALGTLIARQGLRPLHSMAGLVSEIEARNLSRRVPLRGMPHELERLASAFNNMLDRLESAFTRERQFTADASHELRAPLTVIRATAEYALQSHRDSADYRRALQTIGFEAQDLETLIRDLLAAARNESLLGATPANADLSAVVFDVIEELYPIARARSINVTQELTPDLSATIDAQSLTRLVRVLVDNALRHASTSVAVRLSREGSSAILTVTDDGDGFSEEALQHATERFWRDDPSRQRGEGTGLGLSIALGVAQAAGGSIELRNAAGGGGEVRITLPVA